MCASIKPHDATSGNVYENVVAQMLTASGNKLFYYTFPSETSNHLYEIDFLLQVVAIGSEVLWLCDTFFVISSRPVSLTNTWFIQKTIARTKEWFVFLVLWYYFYDSLPHLNWYSKEIPRRTTQARNCSFAHEKCTNLFFNHYIAD